MSGDVGATQMHEAAMQNAVVDPNAAQSAGGMSQAQYQQLVGQLNGGQYLQQGGQPQAYYGQGQPVYNQQGGYGGSEDPYAAYAMAMQQQAGYGMGQPGAGGMNMFAGGGLPGPSYHDPYGMLNPAACVAPLATQVVGQHAGAPQAGAKNNRKKKQGSGLCGCC